MANKPISVTIKGDYNDKDVKRAIKDLQSLQTSGPRTSKALGNLTKGFAIAGAAAGALAVKLGVDAVQAAMEEEVAVSKLARTLENLGLAAADTRVEKFIDDMQFATGIADSELRPAFDRLVRSTGDVALAQSALQTALDTSIGTGRSLDQVVQAIGRAYDGNTQGLSRLGAGLDKAILKSGDMNAIMGELSRTFGGQAATAADTLQGKLAILRIGVDELQESLGKGITQGLMDSLSGGTGDIDDMTASLRENQATLETWGELIGSTIGAAIGWLDAFGLGAMKVADTVADANSLQMRSWINVQDTLGLMSDEQAEAERAALDAADAAREQAMRNYALKGSLDDTADAADASAAATRRLVTAGESDINTMDKRKTAADKLKASLDKLNDNRSIMRQRINLRRMLEEGPQGTGKDGKVTARDRRLFALDVADARAQLGEDIFSQGGKGSRAAARRQFALGRGNIRDLGFGAGFASDILATPEALQRGTGPRPGTPQTGQQVSMVNYNFYGNIEVPDTNAAQQAAKQAKRLAALAGRQTTASAAAYGGYAG